MGRHRRRSNGRPGVRRGGGRGAAAATAVAPRAGVVPCASSSQAAPSTHPPGRGGRLAVLGQAGLRGRPGAGRGAGTVGRLAPCSAGRARPSDSLCMQTYARGQPLAPTHLALALLLLGRRRRLGGSRGLGVGGSCARTAALARTAPRVLTRNCGRRGRGCLLVRRQAQHARKALVLAGASGPRDRRLALEAGGGQRRQVGGPAGGRLQVDRSPQRAVGGLHCDAGGQQRGQGRSRRLEPGLQAGAGLSVLHGARQPQDRAGAKMGAQGSGRGSLLKSGSSAVRPSGPLLGEPGRDLAVDTSAFKRAIEPPRPP